MKKDLLAALAFAMAALSALRFLLKQTLSLPSQQSTRCLDAFNAGDMKTFLAAYAAGDITIVDEFAPHQWVGPNAAQQWADDSVKHATATRVTEGSVTYGTATRSEIGGSDAYVILPTVYRYKQDGRPTMEEGQMTFVLHREDGTWKIRSWTWTGVMPHAAR